MFDFVKKLFSKKQDMPENLDSLPSGFSLTSTNFSDDQRAMGDSIAEAGLGMAGLGDPDAMTTEEETAITDVAREAAVTSPVQSLVDMEAQLKESKKGGMGKNNSAEFTDIIEKMQNVTNASSTNFTDNAQANTNLLMGMSDRMQLLVNSCDNYLNKGNSITAAGKARKNLVTTLKAMILQDVVGIYNVTDKFSGMSPTEHAALNWSEVFRAARTKKIKLDVDMSEVRTMGGAVSTVREIKPGMSKNGSGFFKDDMDIKAGYSTKEAFDLAMEINPLDSKLATVAYGTRGAKALTQKLEDLEKRKTDKNVKVPPSFENLSEDEIASLKKFSSLWLKIFSAYHEANQHLITMSSAGINTGENLRLGERNIATSRIARLLGLGDLVVNTEFAEMEFVENGEQRTIKGLLMSEAKGKEAYDAQTSLDFNDGEILNTILRNGKPAEDPVKELNRFAMPLEDISMSIQRQMSNLQILDFVTGQIDRHFGNLMVTKNADGKYDKITGIDNDFSFGRAKSVRGAIETDEEYDEQGGAVATFAQNARKIIKNGELDVPHMDIELADRIMQIKKPMIEYCLIDLIEPQNIEACWKRVAALQRAITASKSKNDKKFLKKDEWDEKSHDAEIAYAKEKFRVNARGLYSSTSMYTAFMLGALDFTSFERLPTSNPEDQQKLKEAIAAAKKAKAQRQSA